MRKILTIVKQTRQKKLTLTVDASGEVTIKIEIAGRKKVRVNS
jgi:hypothetical protein